LRLGSTRLSQTPLPAGGGCRHEARWVDASQARGLRPFYRFAYYRARGDSLLPTYAYAAPGRSVVFDGGRTTMRYPGPPDDPVVFDGCLDRTLRIDRPYPRNGEASVLLQLIDRSGAVLRRREIRLSAPRLTKARRDSIENAIVNAAAHGGGRPLDRETGRRIREFVDAIPDRLPGFDEARRGASGTIWLRTAADDVTTQKWIVLDSLFLPVAHAVVPATAGVLVVEDDGSWLTTGVDDPSVPFVARIEFDRQRTKDSALAASPLEK
jgi:hypothetical protein